MIDPLKELPANTDLTAKAPFKLAFVKSAPVSQATITKA
jgi:hypothetical protein